jgi:hypothetical protein
VSDTIAAAPPSIPMNSRRFGRPAYTPPPPVYNWTGLYWGGNVGFSWGDAKNDATVLSVGTFSESTRRALAFGMTELAIREDDLLNAYHLPLASLRHTSCSSESMRRSSGNASSRNC